MNFGRPLAVANALKTVEVRLSAAEDRWEGVTSDNLRAFVDLNGLTAREQRVAVQVDVRGIGGVRVVSVSPPSRWASRYFARRSRRITRRPLSFCAKRGGKGMRKSSRRVEWRSHIGLSEDAPLSAGWGSDAFQTAARAQSVSGRRSPATRLQWSTRSKSSTGRAPLIGLDCAGDNLHPTAPLHTTPGGPLPHRHTARRAPAALLPIPAGSQYRPPAHLPTCPPARLARLPAYPPARLTTLPSRW